MTDESVLVAVLATVREHPRLLAFPTLGLVASLLAFPVLVWLVTRGVGLGTRWLAGQVGLPLVVVFPVALYLGIATVVAVTVSLVAFCNVGIVHETAQLRDGATVSVRSGLAAGLAAAPAVLVYGAFAGVAGPTFAVLERGGGAWTARLFDAVAGAPYVAMTYLVGPVAVFESVEPTATFDRSASLLRSRFGPLPVVSVSVLEVAIVVGATPLVLVQTVAIIDGVTSGSAVVDLLTANPVLAGSLPLALLWVGVVAGGALGAVAKTALYLAIDEDLDTLPILDLDVDEAVSVAGR